MLFSAPLKNNSTKIMLLGSGELGREVAIESQRLGIEVIAVDRYAHAPAHLVANRSHVVNMQDRQAVLVADLTDGHGIVQILQLMGDVADLGLGDLHRQIPLGFRTGPPARAPRNARPSEPACVPGQHSAGP